MIKYNLTRESITFIYEGKSYAVQKDAPNYLPIREALLAEKWEEIPKHLTIGKSLEEWAKGEFKVDGSTIRYKGEQLPDNLNSRIVSMARVGSDPTPIFKFWERLQKNPSMRSVTQLWGFLEHRHIPLTTNGTFYAYKGVRSDYKDQHSGTIGNSPGAINRMPRNKISDDPKVECHFGFHVGALEYARTFSSQVVVCEVDPEHVVCVPYDHSSQKMRVCEYKVVGNYGGPLPSVVVVPEEESEVEEFEETDEDDFEDNEEDDEKGDSSEERPVGDPEESLEEREEGTEDKEDPFDVTHEDADREVKAAEKKRAKEKALEEKKAKQDERKKARQTREVNPEKRAVNKGFKKYAPMDMAELMKQSLDDLRKYAAIGLEIVGASKIAGGKVELVRRILMVRKGESK